MRPSRAKREKAVECELCTDAAVARLSACDLNWPLCSGHLKASLAFIEPL